MRMRSRFAFPASVCLLLSFPLSRLVLCRPTNKPCLCLPTPRPRHGGGGSHGLPEEPPSRYKPNVTRRKSLRFTSPDLRLAEPVLHQVPNAEPAGPFLTRRITAVRFSLMRMEFDTLHLTVALNTGATAMPQQPFWLQACRVKRFRSVIPADVVPADVVLACLTWR